MKPLPLFIAVVSFGTIASAQTAETETVRVVLFGSVVATGVYVAHDLGYFTDEGLDVSIEHTPTSKYLVTELVKGTYQIAQASIDNFFAYQGGQGAAPLDREPDLRVFMGGATLDLNLVTRPEVNSYEDLRGKNIGVDAATTGWAFVMRRMLERGGSLEAGDYELVEVGNTRKLSEALVAGRTHASILFGSFFDEALAAGMKRLDGSFERIGPYQGSSFAVSDAWARAHPETVTGFARAYIRAMDVVFDLDRREDVIDILTSHVSMTRAIAAANLSGLTSSTVGFSRNGALSMEGVETVLSLRNDYGTPPHDFTDLDGFVDLSYYEQALQTLSKPKIAVFSDPQSHHSKR